MKTAEPPPELIFQWERRSRVRWRLGGIVALSLLAHAVSFYVLQVAYTPTGSQLPPPAQVVMVTPDQPGSEALAHWLAMADPARIVQPAAPSREETLASLGFRYVPSWEAAPSGFKSLDPLPGENPVASPPRPRPDGPVPVGREKLVPPPKKVAPGRQPTRVLLKGGIEARLSDVLPPVEFSTSKISEPLEPTVFLVGVRSEGGPPFLFQKTKPGNAAADAYARDYLARLVFSPSDRPDDGDILWGLGEFSWGRDIYP